MYIYIYIATTTETHALKTGCSFTCVGTDLFQVFIFLWVFWCGGLFTNRSSESLKNFPPQTGWWQLNIFYIFTPILGGFMIQFDGRIFFKWVGEINHQLAKIYQRKKTHFGGGYLKLRLHNLSSFGPESRKTATSWPWWNLLYFEGWNPSQV